MPKTLTIRDEVYKKLVAVKEKDESFSELFERLVDGRSPNELVASLRGTVKLSNENTRKLLRDIAKHRDERRVF